MSRRFPILRQGDERHVLVEMGYPRSVPWNFLAPHEAQAERNHGQSLDLLAKRGGLSPAEMLAIVTGRLWIEMDRSAMGLADARVKLLELIPTTEHRCIADMPGGTRFHYADAMWTVVNREDADAIIGVDYHGTLCVQIESGRAILLADRCYVEAEI